VATAVTIETTASSSANSGATVEVTLPSAANADDLLLIVAASLGDGYIDSVTIDGAVPTLIQSPLTGGANDATVDSRLVRCAGGETNVAIRVANTGYKSVVTAYQIRNAAHLKPLKTAYTSGTGGTPTMPTWTADASTATGLVFGVYAAGEHPVADMPYPGPVPWTIDSYGFGGGTGEPDHEFAHQEFAPGAQAADPWTNPVGAATSWYTAVFAFYEPGLTLEPAVGYARVGGVTREFSGGLELVRSVPITPDPEGAMPPEPTEIEVPLPPWVPGTGPYRHG
jgi:hypothetical protein